MGMGRLNDGPPTWHSYAKTHQPPDSEYCHDGRWALRVTKHERADPLGQRLNHSLCCVT